MPADFPDAVDSFPDRDALSAETLEASDHAQLHEDLGAAIVAVETRVIDDLRRRIVTIPTEQAADIVATPVELVPALGAGKLIVVTHITVEQTLGTCGWTPENVSRSLIIFYNDGNPPTANVNLALSDLGYFLFTSPRWIGATAPLAVGITRGSGANRALMVTSTPLVEVGAIASIASTPTAPGSGYAPGDTGVITTVEPGSASAGYVVDTVDGGGGVLTLHLTDPGFGFRVATGVSTEVSTGGGDGTLTVEVLTLPAPDVDMRISVLYRVLDVEVDLS